jgi:osmoprotectant transport system substrate-binding protein
MLKSPRIRALILLSIMLLLYTAARLMLHRNAPPNSIAIGSKNFTESLILGEFYAKTLENAGYPVTRKFNLGGTLIAHEALKRGEIDLYPEYTGTGLLNILHRTPPQNPQAAIDLLNQEYQKQWRLIWLKPSLANDSQGLVTTQEISTKYHLRTLSQLAKLAPQLRLGSIPEFEDRADGLPGLRKYYGGFRLKKIMLFDNGLKYQALQTRQTDVIVGFTTDGALSNPQFVLLEDDRKFWPLYQVALVMRESLAQEKPAIVALLNRASAQLTTDTLQQLNRQVDLDKKDYRQVVKAFLAKSEGQ